MQLRTGCLLPSPLTLVGARLGCCHSAQHAAGHSLPTPIMWHQHAITCRLLTACALQELGQLEGLPQTGAEGPAMPAGSSQDLQGISQAALVQAIALMESRWESAQAQVCTCAID